MLVRNTQDLQLPELEKVRNEIIYEGLDDENFLSAVRLKMSLYGSHFPSHDGKILGGKLHESRMDSFFDTLERIIPYMEITRESKKVKDDILEEYRKMAESMPMSSYEMEEQLKGKKE